MNQGCIFLTIWGKKWTIRHQKATYFLFEQKCIDFPLKYSSKVRWDVTLKVKFLPIKSFRCWFRRHLKPKKLTALCCFPLISGESFLYKLRKKLLPFFKVLNCTRVICCHPPPHFCKPSFSSKISNCSLAMCVNDRFEISFTDPYLPTE